MYFQESVSGYDMMMMMMKKERYRKWKLKVLMAVDLEMKEGGGC
jgi:hypothetical protein